MPKTQPSYMPNQISRERVLIELEKKSFISLPGREGHSGLLASKTVIPAKEDLMKS